MRAHQIMTRSVITVRPDATIIEAANTMLRWHVSGLPVVDRAGKLVGIVSEGDFIHRGIIGCGPAGAEQEFEPAAPSALCANFAAVNEIALRDDADELAGPVDHRKAADMPPQHGVGGLKDWRSRPRNARTSTSPEV